MMEQRKTGLTFWKRLYAERLLKIDKMTLIKGNEAIAGKKGRDYLLSSL
jgi:hypothetical protein